MPDAPLVSPAPPAPSAPSAPPAAGKDQRVLTMILWAGMILAMLGVVGGKFIFPHRDIAMLFPAGSFSLTDQDARQVSDVTLRGKPYVCDFIFTTCGSACPIMTKKMIELQKTSPAGVGFVSFTVNPEHDTPPILKEYARFYAGDETRWRLLTGTPPQMAAVAEQMHITAQPKSNSDPIIHSEHFLLIDGDGNVRGAYNSNDPSRLQQLVDDAKYLARSRGGRG